MKFLACREVIPECGWSTHAETEEEILSQAAEHMRNKHGIKELSPLLCDKFRSLMGEDPSSSYEELQAA